ncbi:O-antigen polymerase [uncultured Jatrophihabitans sp.]|uniref:O-antigen polymerase n=1 Tax=uncultured Jatrophihabitans sp. TaxID=1610747 RepID=UPI0035CB47E5
MTVRAELAESCNPRVVRAKSSVAVVPLTVVAGLGVPMLIARGVPSTKSEWLIFATAAYSGIRLSTVVLARTPQPTKTFTWIFFYFVLGLAPLNQYERGVWPLYPPPASPVYVTQAAVMVACFVVFVDVGMALLRAIAIRRPLQDREPRYVLAPGRLRFVLPLAILGAIYAFGHIGGGSALFTSRLSRAQSLAANTSTSIAFLSALLTVPVFICAYVLLVARRTGAVHGRRFLAVGLVLLSVILTNPYSSSRFTLLTVYVSLLFAARWPLTRRLLTKLVALTVVGLFILFPLLNVFRTNQRTQSTTGAITKQLSGGDFDSFQQIVNNVDYVDAKGFQMGREELSAVLFFVPHSVWPGRAKDTGTRVAEYKGYAFTNLSDPLPAEAYVDGGPVWVVVIAVAYGALVERMEGYGRRFAMSPGWWQLFAPVFSIYQLSVLRGSLLQSTGILVAIGLMLRVCVKPRIRQSGNHDTGVAG